MQVTRCAALPAAAAIIPRPALAGYNRQNCLRSEEKPQLYIECIAERRFYAHGHLVLLLNNFVYLPTYIICNKETNVPCFQFWRL